MRLREVAKATGLDEDTLRRLERKGVIQATRDANGHRVFDPSVVKLLRERYKDRMQPKTTPQYDLKIAEAKAGERCPGCGGPLAIKGTLHATQGVGALDVFSDVGSKLMQFAKSVKTMIAGWLMHGSTGRKARSSTTKARLRM